MSFCQYVFMESHHIFFFFIEERNLSYLDWMFVYGSANKEFRLKELMVVTMRYMVSLVSSECLFTVNLFY